MKHNYLQLIGSELSHFQKKKKKQMMLVHKMAIFIRQALQAIAKEKAPAESIVETSIQNLRRKIA